MFDRTEQGLLALLLIASGWLFVYFDRLNNPNELVRIYMARALAENGSYAIGRRVPDGHGKFKDVGSLYEQWGYVNDKALVCDRRSVHPPDCTGTLYAAKAPGPSFLAAPVLFAFHGLTRRWPTRTEAVLLLRWLYCLLPTAFFWIFVRRFLLRSGVSPPIATACLLAGALGSLSFTYGQMFAGHQLAALALGTELLVAFWPTEDGVPKSSDARAMVVGLAAGWAVCIEYPSAPAALVIGLGWLFARRTTAKSLGLSALAALLPLLLLAHFQWAAFGSPWSTPYSHLENAGFVRDIAPGILGISSPSLERVMGSLFLPYLGLFFWAPWTALALLAAPVLLRSKDATALTCLAVVAYYLVFQVTHALWRSGWTVGPRYVTPLIPFAAICVGLGLSRLRAPVQGWALAVLGGSGAASVAATGLASTVCQGFPLEVYNPLVEVVAPLLVHGYVPRNLLQLAGVPGLWSAFPALASLGLALALLLTAPLDHARPSRALVGLSVLVAAWLCLGQWTANSGISHAHDGAARFLASVWQPDLPPGASPF